MLLLLGGAIAWLLAPQRHLMFRGKSDREWAEQLSVELELQIPFWRNSGPEGVRFLGHALERRRSASASLRYQLELWADRNLPATIARRIPSRADDYERQIHFLFALSLLGTNALPAEPSIALGLREPFFAHLAFECYFDPVSGDALLHVMDEAAKNARLPDFLWALEPAQAELGIDALAAGALRHYPNHKAVIMPALTNAFTTADAPLKGVIMQTLEIIAPEVAAAMTPSPEPDAN